MPQYVTDIKVSPNEAEAGYTSLGTNLNEGTTGPPIYLLFKTGGGKAITRIQFSYNEGMQAGLAAANYTMDPQMINAGTSGDPIHLWSFKGSLKYDVPIVQLAASTDPERDAELAAEPLWERCACDLNHGVKEKWIYLWMKRETQTYIHDITATDHRDVDANLFKQGYIRIDENTNRNAGGKEIFLFYLQSTDVSSTISELQVSFNNNPVSHFKPVGTNLNEGTGGTPVYLWFKKGSNKPIKMILLLRDIDSAQLYENAGMTIIRKNLNEGNGGMEGYLCYK